MVVPVLGREDGRDAHCDDRCRGCRRHVVALREPGDQVAQGQHAESDPDREGVERSRIDVVAFARLAGRGVEVEDQRDAHHHEQPQHDREVALVAVQLVDESDESQQEGEEIIGVPALVFGDFARQVVLRADVFLVDPADTREPVAVGDRRARRLYVALASHEVPHEIAPVHVRKLVVEEEMDVFPERRFGDRAGFAVGVGVGPFASEVERLAAHGTPLCVAQDLALVVAQRLGLGAVGGPLLVGLFALRVVPHAGEELHELRSVGVAREHRGGLVLAVLVQIPHLLLLHALGGSRILRAVQQRAVAVLVAVQERQQGVGVVGVVGVHRRVRRGADGHRGVGRVADENHGRREQDDVEQHAAPSVGGPCGPSQADDQRQREERDARVDRQAERVDEQRVDLRPDPDGVGDDDVVDEDDHRPGHERREGDASPGHRGGLAEVVDEDQRGDAEQVEDVHADRESHQVGDQHDPARGVGFVGLLLPFEHQPHDQRREHRRERVDLALDGREPERVGEGVGQGPDGSGAQDGPCVGGGELRAVARHQTPCQVGDGPEQEQDAEGAGQRVHGVDGDAHVVGVSEGEERGQARQHHEQRGSGRVSHFEFVGCRDELRAVPEA